MEKFFNDITTMIATMDTYLKISIIALLTILDIFILKAFISNLAKSNGKPKIKIVNVLLFVIVSALLVLIFAYGFN